MSRLSRVCKSLAGFMTDALKKRCGELKSLDLGAGSPELKHFNIFEDHVMVIDGKNSRIANVNSCENGTQCDICEKKNCRGV